MQLGAVGRAADIARSGERRQVSGPGAWTDRRWRGGLGSGAMLGLVRHRPRCDPLEKS